MKKYISAAKTTDPYFVVHYSWDEGGPESGPIIKGDNIVIKARNKYAAEAKALSKLGDNIDSCWAEPATEEDVKAFAQDMKDAREEYEYLVSIGVIDPNFVNER